MKNKRVPNKKIAELSVEDKVSNIALTVFGIILLIVAIIGIVNAIKTTNAEKSIHPETAPAYEEVDINV